jgi:catechol 2,3-dioxygenase-like lactoylglutathione lyase family enzyme
MEITGTDFVGIPSRDAERSRAFYVDVLGLRPDRHGRFEVWAGSTCFTIWEPARMGMEFAPQRNAHPALHVDDVAAARAELEAGGVEFHGETLDTGVCHMALFSDPDGNDLMLHRRYAPYGE